MKNWTIVTNLFLFIIIGCSKSGSIPGDHGSISALQNKSFFEKVGEVKPYNPFSSYAKKMAICVYADTSEKSCTVQSLPLLGISKEKITPQDILDRTMISHDFLGVAFKEVLNKMNPEMLQMFGSVNAVVISDKINPSFYWTKPGAIYLSGSYFWKNAEEYDLLHQVKDYRQDFGNAFQFIFDSDYIKDGKSITERADQNFQTYDEMSYRVIRLLFHELTHANDFFPRSFYKSQDINLNQTYSEIASGRYLNDQLISQKQATKLASLKLSHLGEIFFQGEEATPEDSSILAEEVVQEFKNDIATDYYSYSTPMEDLAMSAEEALMLYYYNIPRLVIVIKLPEPHFVVPANYNYIIGWGEKSRVLEPNIKGRALYAVENLLGKSIAQKVSDKMDQFSFKEIPANTSWEDIYKL